MARSVKFFVTSVLIVGLAVSAGCSDDDSNPGPPDTPTLEFEPGIYQVKVQVFSSSSVCSLLQPPPDTPPTIVNLCEGDGELPIPITGCTVTVNTNSATLSDCNGLFNLSAGGVTCLLRFTGSNTTAPDRFTVSLSGNFEFIEGCLPGVTCPNTTFVFTGTLNQPCTQQSQAVSVEQALAAIFAPYQP